MRTYTSRFLAYAYKDLLRDLLYDPEYTVKPRDMEVKEITNCVVHVERPLVNLFKNEHRSSKQKYIAAELLWYFSGTNDPTFIENYASLWKNLHNKDGTVNSAYGNLIFSEKTHGMTQYQWVIESLKRDRDSRQAFMHFNKPSHQFFDNKDQVCTMNAVFHIRENMLNMTLNMRSNDVIYGFPTDWAFFSVLQYHVYLHLLRYYPNLMLGSYTHISHSMHLYERHYSVVKDMLSKSFQSDMLPVFKDTIVEEDGSIKEEYYQVFESILKDGELDPLTEEPDNELLKWCLNKLK